MPLENLPSEISPAVMQCHIEQSSQDWPKSLYWIINICYIKQNQQTMLCRLRLYSTIYEVSAFNFFLTLFYIQTKLSITFLFMKILRAFCTLQRSTIQGIHHLRDTFLFNLLMTVGSGEGGHSTIYFLQVLGCLTPFYLSFSAAQAFLFLTWHSLLKYASVHPVFSQAQATIVRHIIA